MLFKHRISEIKCIGSKALGTKLTCRSMSNLSIVYIFITWKVPILQIRYTVY